MATVGSSSHGITDSSASGPVMDVGRKYGTMDPNNRNNFTCNLCGKVTKGGIHRLKQNLVGGFRNVSKCPEPIREEVKAFMEKKEQVKAGKYAIVEDQQQDEENTSSEEEENVVPLPKKAKTKGPLDLFFKRKPEMTKASKGGRQQTINEVCKKELRGKACQLYRPLHGAGFYLNPGVFYDRMDEVSSREVMEGFLACVTRLVPNMEVQDKIMNEVGMYRNAEGTIFGGSLAVRQQIGGLAMAHTLRICRNLQFEF